MRKTCSRSPAKKACSSCTAIDSPDPLQTVKQAEFLFYPITRRRLFSHRPSSS